MNLGNATMVDSSDQIRESKCYEAITYQLKKFNCVILPELRIIGGNMNTRWVVKAIPRKVMADTRKGDS